MERALRPFVIFYLADNQPSPQELAREPSRRAGLQRMAVELQRLRARRAKGTIRLMQVDHQRRVAGSVIRDERL
ncbi:MAG TPA: hypothetical protein VFU81_13080 [Thermomicrobiales bacterium]|nr:hypothetical protein [Thermomicrobiales bacterium]